MSQNNTYEIRLINRELLCDVSKCKENELTLVNRLDLHLKDLQDENTQQFTMQKIQKIMNLDLVPNLMYLSLSHNTISKIEGFERLPHLLELNLAENSIKTIENLYHLKKLEKLNLNGNQITRIPSAFSSMQKLTNLRLARNHLNSLNDLENLSDLRLLTDLTLNDNFYPDECYVVNRFSSPWCVYQMHTIDMIPSLTKLDMLDIEASHRRQCQNWTTPRSAFAVVSNNPSFNRLPVTVEPVKTTVSGNHLNTLNERRQMKEDPEPEPRPSVSPMTAVSARSVTTSPPELFTPARTVTTAHQIQSSPSDIIVASANKTISDLQRRVEIMTTKLLASDSERNSLQTELTALRASRATDLADLTAQVQELTEQLADSERRLQDSVEREETATRQLAVRSGEAETSRLESERNAQLLASLRGEMQHVAAERDRLGDETRSLREALLERDTALTVQAAKRLSALDEWRAGESRREIVSGRMDTEELRVLIERQQRDLESLVRELSAANETITSCRAEADKLKAKLIQTEESGRTGKSRVMELETETRALQNAHRDLADRAAVAREECDEYRPMYERVDADMRSYLRSAEQHGANKSHTRDSPRRERSSGQKTRSSGRYLNSMSTDSESPSPDPGEEEQGDSAEFHRQAFSSPLSRNMPGRFSLSVLEQKAAEIMAHMLTEELQRTGARGAVSEFTTSAGLKEACSIVALRLLHTSVNVVRDEEQDRNGDNHAHSADPSATPDVRTPRSVNRQLSYRKSNKLSGVHFQGVPLSPFHVLGDRRYLSRLVTETQEGITSLEDARSLQKEVQQLKKLVEEREKAADAIQRDIAEKHQLLSGLRGHCEEARSKANETLDELGLLAKRLQAGRDDISTVEAEFSLARRELELSNSRLREARAMTQLEDKNLVQLRAKLAETRDQQSATEEQLLVTKDLLLKEEDKLRKTTGYADNRLRQLQADLHRFETDYKAKQRTKDDLEKQQRAVAEDNDLRRRDSEAQLAILSRQHEEEHRRLHGVKEEISVATMERDILMSKRRTLEAEIAKMQEKVDGLSSRFSTEDQEAQRKLDSYDKKVLDQEKRIRTSKGQLATLEGEQAVLRASIDELQRLHVELDRNKEQKHRVAEEELALLKNHSQLAVREANQKKADAEHLRVEIETLSSEKNSLERQRDAAKRALHEHDMLLDSRRDALKACELEKERLLQDSSQLKKSDDSLAHQQQVVKSELEADRRLLEDGRRKLAQWREEEASIRESQAKLRNSYALKSKELDDLRAKLDAVNAQCEREKRELMDARTKKSLIEGDLHRLEEEVKCAVERNNEEGIRRVETEAVLRKVSDDLNRLTREVVNREKQIGDARRLEEDLRHREQELKMSQERIRVETETHKAAIQNERSLVDRLQDEHRQLSSETRQAAEENKRLRQELDRNKIGVESTKAQQTRLEQVKDELSSEIHALRETSRQELVRTEALEKVYGHVESRLQLLREDLQRAEEAAQKSRSVGEEEAHRVAEQRRVLRLSMDELSRIQISISDANKQLHEERQRAVFEIGQLGQAKQSANAHMFLVAEAGKRQDKVGKVLPDKLSSAASTLPLDKYSHSSSLDSRYPLYTVTAAPSHAPVLSSSSSALTGNNFFEPYSRVSAPRSAPSVDGVVVSNTGPRMADAELSTLQRELEALRSTSSAILSGAASQK